jgi:hypothetical protein
LQRPEEEFKREVYKIRAFKTRKKSRIFQAGLIPERKRPAGRLRKKMRSGEAQNKG